MTSPSAQEFSARDVRPAMSAQQKAFSGVQGSALATYRALAVGDQSNLFLAWYELVTLALTNCPGLIGFAGRSLLYPTLLRCCGTRPAIGRGVALRNPKSVSLGKRVLIDDLASLDVRGPGSIQLDDFVSIGRHSILVSKSGSIHLCSAVNVGSFCRIATQSQIHIGASTLIAAYCYIGPGNHQLGDGKEAMIEREMEIRGGVTIGSNCWIGTHSTVLDGVTIGDGAVIGAHSLVRDNVAPYSVVAGVPAREIKKLPEPKN